MRFALIVLMAALLSACGLEAGTVYKKDYEPAHTYTESVPHQIPAGQTCDANNYCTPNYTTFWTEEERYEPEHWVVYFKDGEDKGSDYVSESEYEQIEIGDWYGESEDVDNG